MLVSAYVLCCTPTYAQTVDPAAKPKETPVDDVAAMIKANEKLAGDALLLKSGRNLPKDGVQTLPNLPNPQGTDVTPSEGLSVIERMGGKLPDLPVEKPYTGKPDLAFGAFQRGLYLQAMELALPRAQLGDASAQTLVAELMASGLGVKRNVRDAVFWYEQAAKAGDPNAEYKYALVLMDGSLVARDKVKADEYMRKAADGGNKFAQFNIAQILVAAKPGDEGLRAAFPYYEKSALQGVPDAQYAMAQLLMNLDFPEGKRAEARGWLEKAAKAGFDTAEYDMGVWLVNGVGGTVDFDKGFAWMKKAADGGHVLAQNKLAHLYINALGTRPDTVEATKWYVLSRRAGLKDLELEDFYLGISEDVQKQGVMAANRFKPVR